MRQGGAGATMSKRGVRGTAATEATRFLAEVRDAQRRSGRTLGGQRFLSDTTRRRMERAWRACRRGFAISTGDTTSVRQGIAALEEMCRRRQVEMPDRLRPAV